MSDSIVAEKPNAPPAENQRPQIGWRFWLLWVVATTVGWVLGRFLGDFVVTLIPPLVNLDVPVRTTLVVGGALSGVVSGAVVGAAQWLLLRGKVSQAGRWVLASSLSFAVGWSLGLTLILIAGWSLFGNVFGALFGALFGAVVGTAQWFVLREKVSQAGWWILASSLGWGYLSPPLGSLSPLGSLVGWPIPMAAIVAGCITGGALVWLLRQPIRDDDKTEQTGAILALDVDDGQNSKPVRLRDKDDVSNWAAAGTGAVTGAIIMLVVIIAFVLSLSPSRGGDTNALGIVLAVTVFSSPFLIIGAALPGAIGGVIGGKIGYPSRKIGPAVGGMVLTIMFLICSTLGFGFPPMFFF